MPRRIFIVLLLPLLVGCDQRISPTPAPAPAPSAGARQSPAVRASQPRGATPPEGLTEKDFFDLGDIKSGDHVYVKGVALQMRPFDPDGATIQLLSIECPHIDEPFGPEAQAYTQEFLASKQGWVDMHWKSKVDPAKGHAYIYRCPDGAFLNVALVRQGFARVTDVGNPETIAVLRKAEESAKAAKVGIWK